MIRGHPPEKMHSTFMHFPRATYAEAQQVPGLYYRVPGRARYYRVPGARSRGGEELVGADASAQEQGSSHSSAVSCSVCGGGAGGAPWLRPVDRHTGHDGSGLGRRRDHTSSSAGHRGEGAGSHPCAPVAAGRLSACGR
eukprot:COSAG01_NODE_10935_length_2045_cov_137.567831_3_plen_139_part_00